MIDKILGRLKRGDAGNKSCFDPFLGSYRKDNQDRHRYDIFLFRYREAGIQGDIPDPPPPVPTDTPNLYNWQALIDPRGIAPTGFAPANEDDWADLLGYLGGKEIAGGKLKAVDGFDEPNTGATNEFGFDGISTGIRNPDGTFSNLGTYSYHWIKNINE